MPNVVFRPRVSERTPSKTFFAELCTAPGPQTIGVTGDNSFQTLFGREWLLEWSVEDDHLRLYQESSTHPGEWERILTPLPPVFDSPLPATARRVSFAFDQSARMIVALEDEGVVKVTRWDPGLSQYIQNVSFAGVDPAVVMDATWAYDIPNSDVLIFYLSSDRTKVLCRVQRELYATENELWDYGQQVILDRALPAFLRYQLLISDASGGPLPEALLSAPYSYPLHAALAGEGSGPTAGFYTNIVLQSAMEDSLAGMGVGPSGGAYLEPILEYSLSDAALGVGAGPSGGAYLEPILEYGLSDAVSGMALGPSSGDYHLVVFAEDVGSDAISVSGTGPSGGSYDPA